MRVRVLFGAMMLAGCGVVAGCGGSDANPVGPGEEQQDAGGGGGGGSSGGPGGDAGPLPPGPDGGSDGGAPWNTPKTLKSGTILLLGVTTGSDPHAVYASLAQSGASLEAVSLAGGAPVVLAPTLYVQGGDTAVVAGGAGTVRPGFDADTGGTKLFAVSSDANATGRIITVATADVQDLEDQTGPGVVLPDGSAVIYRTATGLRRASANGMPNPTSLVDGAKALLGVASDVSRVLYRTLDEAPTGVDLRSIGTAAGSTPAEIVGTGTSRALGFSGSNADVLYFTDISQAGAKLKSKPAAGGAERELASGIAGAVPAPAGDSVITFANPTQPVPNVTVVEISHVSAKGGAVTKLADAVPQGGLAFSGKKLVYTRFAEQGSGLYTLELP